MFESLASHRYMKLSSTRQYWILLFSSWVLGDILRLQSAGTEIAYVNIDKYEIDAQSLSVDPRRRYTYRTRIELNGDEWVVTQWLPDSEQGLSAEPTTTGAIVDRQTFLTLMQQVAQFEIQDVRKKPIEVADHLADPKRTDSPSDFASTVNSGFRVAGMENGQHQFDSVGGEVSIRFKNGAQYNIHLGNLAGIDTTDNSKFSRYLLVTAELDETQLPMPQRGDRTSGESSGEGGDSDDVESTDRSVDVGEQDSEDEQERQYQRMLKDREASLQVAQERVKALNQVSADWYYVVGESVPNNLFPPAEKWIAERDPQ